MQLFSFFRNNYNTKSAISYYGISKLEVSVYEKVGMKLDNKTMTAKVWSKDSKKVTDNLLISREYYHLFYTNCGQRVFAWNKVLESD